MRVASSPALPYSLLSSIYLFLFSDLLIHINNLFLPKEKKENYIKNMEDQIIEEKKREKKTKLTHQRNVEKEEKSGGEIKRQKKRGGWSKKLSPSPKTNGGLIAS